MTDKLELKNEENGDTVRLTVDRSSIHIQVNESVNEDYVPTGEATAVASISVAEARILHDWLTKVLPSL